MIIYKITNNINGKLYIGKTTKTLEKRFTQHKTLAIKGCERHLYCAMRKYGIENFKVEQIDTACSEEELAQKEDYWIHYYNSIQDGYNMIDNEESPMKYEKVHEKHESRMKSKEVRERISKSLSEYRKKYGFTQEHLEKIKKSLIGNKHFAGHKRSEYAKECTCKALSKSVYCVDNEGHVVKSFVNVKDAARWWYDYDKFNLKSKTYLCNYIKSSSRDNKYIRSLKWIYGCPCVETTESITKD